MTTKNNNVCGISVETKIPDSLGDTAAKNVAAICDSVNRVAMTLSDISKLNEAALGLANTLCNLTKASAYYPPVTTSISGCNISIPPMHRSEVNGGGVELRTMARVRSRKKK